MRTRPGPGGAKHSIRMVRYGSLLFVGLTIRFVQRIVCKGFARSFRIFLRMFMKL